ncbi:MAG: GH3 auxin-responsive promoter family protein [Caldilineaceae bacterium]|nr:GH3 auxin-responsive promoter family protein [Caldilineaceae bacterium]
MGASFTLLACERLTQGHAYTLFIQPGADIDTTDGEIIDDVLARLAAPLDRALAENFHYAYCRRLGQLQPVAVFRITGDGLADYLAGCVARGQRAGDVKPVALGPGGGMDGAIRWLFGGATFREWDGTTRVTEERPSHCRNAGTDSCWPVAFVLHFRHEARFNEQHLSFV